MASITINMVVVQVDLLVIAQVKRLPIKIHTAEHNAQLDGWLLGHYSTC